MAAHHSATFAADAPLIDQGRRVLVERGFGVRGTDISAASRMFAEYHDAVRGLMTGVDVLVTPTVPCAPFPVEEDFPDMPGRPDPLGWAIYTYPFNITGQPAISVPCGSDRNGMPVGLQIVGPWRRDDLVLRLARAFEDSRGPWTYPNDRSQQNEQ